MTAAVQEKDGWPPGILFRPPRSIGWQTDIIIRMYLMTAAMLVADTGTGKSMMTMGVAGLAAERGTADHVLVVCERNKLREWLEDFGRCTRLDAAIYHGPKRKALLASLPRVIITTYETARDDLAIAPPRGSRSRKLAPGPLLEALAGSGIVVAYDEITKLGRRTSGLYKAHHWALGKLRSAAECRVIGLTATPMDTDYENIFSELRLVVPHAMPTVAEFDRRVVRSRHPVYRTPNYDPEGVEWFRSLAEPWMIRKRKTDPDVRDDFPPLTERFRRIEMRPDQFRLYRELEDLAWDRNGQPREVKGLPVLLRQLAGDPLAVLEAARAGDSPLAKMVAEERGAELAKCSSAKADELISLADLVMSSGGKLVVFTFFGQTVLPVLKKRLGDRTVFTYHGQMTDAERERNKQAFREHQGPAVLLMSDAGMRGINLPEATVIVEYDIAGRHSQREQRKGRGHRLGRRELLTFISFVLESTIEQNSYRSLMARNDQQDFMLRDGEDPDYTKAADRRDLYAQARPRKAGASA